MRHEPNEDRLASLNRLAPELWRSASVLYVGASTGRFDYSREFREAGVSLSVLEAFGPNVRYLRTLPWLEAVHQADVRQFEAPRSFDAVMWWHGPEHIAEHELPATLARLEACATQLVVLGCPWGVYRQGAVYGNPYERHVSHYGHEPFEALGYAVECLGTRNVPGSNITAVKRTTAPSNSSPPS